ncbi:hypothetical protein B0H13DRAFT_1630555, partial [Mycena leptocephala]
RCTFCAKVYTGVNAKSMWRRHVLAKHRVWLGKYRHCSLKLNNCPPCVEPTGT